VSPQRKSLFAATLLLATAVLMVPLRVAADDAGASASDAGVAADDAATATQDAGAAEDGGEAAAPPRWDEAAFSDEVTPRPKPEDWGKAPVVSLGPSTSALRAAQCKARRLREWLRIRCEGRSVGVVRMLGGRRDGMETRLGSSSSEFDDFPQSVELVLALRRGDLRVLEVLEIALGYKGSSSIEPWFVFSEHWPAEDDAPSISLN